jgi:hypothetical protein
MIHFWCKFWDRFLENVEKREEIEGESSDRAQFNMTMPKCTMLI